MKIFFYYTPGNTSHRLVHVMLLSIGHPENLEGQCQPQPRGVVKANKLNTSRG